MSREAASIAWPAHFHHLNKQQEDPRKSDSLKQNTPPFLLIIGSPDWLGCYIHTHQFCDTMHLSGKDELEYTMVHVHVVGVKFQYSNLIIGKVV